MKNKMVSSFFFLILISYLYLPLGVNANSNNNFVTIINPVRVAPYTKNVSASINSEYIQISKHDLPATWLLTFDVLRDPEAIKSLKKFDKRQELGIFAEVSQDLAKVSGVDYVRPETWNLAKSLFLIGYSQPDRLKLIDKMFEEYKASLGAYPKSVGGWWIDAYSLSYMHEKYGVISALLCSDQLDTDGYTIQGQYWSSPYFSSKLHSGVPARNKSDSNGVVIVQWAQRDPDLGYKNSLYSTQDYFTVPNLDATYYKKLASYYLYNSNNLFGQLTTGLEGDMDESIYNNGHLSKQIEALLDIKKSSGLSFVTSRDFSEWFIKKFNYSTPMHHISDGASEWISSPIKRVYKRSGIEIEVRNYNHQIEEPYFKSPLRQNKMNINISPPSVVPAELGEGYVVLDFPVEKDYFLKNSLWPLHILKAIKSGIFNKTKYLIPSGEVESLNYLSTLPRGNVLTTSADCLQCSWHTKYKPIVFANARSYISILSNKPIIKNKAFFLSTSQIFVKDYLKTNHIKYIYISIHEEYAEKLSMSPGDYDIQLIFENSNSQIWKVKS